VKFWNLSTSSAEKGVDIALYGVIGDDWFGPPVEAEIAAQLAAHSEQHVTVHINSEGGDMFAGIAIRNLLAAHPGGVTCVVEGLAASAASIIAMAGRTIMGRGAMMMIHNPWAIAAGSAADLRATADMLDKARSSLIAVYEAKTGKSAADLQALLDAETWMTADEAKAAGFADEIADQAMAVENRADAVLLNSIEFPREKVPARILAMAPATTSAAPAVEAAITREVVQARAPSLLSALLAEGHAAGVAAERARLKAIDEIDQPGHADLVTAAKYGEQPSDAPTLAMAILRANKQAGVDLLAARRSESQVAAGIRATAPDNAGSGSLAAVARRMNASPGEAR
jgi:ATP-dependent protease ClpP protease subunit